MKIEHVELKKCRVNDTRHGRYYDLTLSTGEVLRRLSTTTRLNAMHNENLVRWRTDQVARIHTVAAHKAYRVGGDLATILIAYEQMLADEKARLKDESGANTGELIHRHIEALCKGDETVPETEEVDIAVRAWSKWAKSVKLKPLANELTVWSALSAGTIDFIGEVDGLLYMLDWKTGKRYPEYDLQLAEYWRAYHNLAERGMLGPDAPVLEGCAIVQIPKTSPGEVLVHERSMEDLYNDGHIFDAVCEVDDWIREHALAKPLAVASY